MRYHYCPLSSWFCEHTCSLGLATIILYAASRQTWILSSRNSRRAEQNIQLYDRWGHEAWSDVLENQTNDGRKPMVCKRRIWEGDGEITIAEYNEFVKKNSIVCIPFHNAPSFTKNKNLASRLIGVLISQSEYYFLWFYSVAFIVPASNGDIFGWLANSGESDLYFR